MADALSPEMAELPWRESPLFGLLLVEHSLRNIERVMVGNDVLPDRVADEFVVRLVRHVRPILASVIDRAFSAGDEFDRLLRADNS